MRLVAVVPALDEAPRIGAVVGALTALLDARTGAPVVERVIVIDDGSLDGTREAALAAAPRRALPTGAPRVEVLRNEQRRGVGAAISRGYQRALELEADAAVVLAGDAQMDVRDLPAVLAPLRDGRADYVKGNRLAWSGGAVAFPLERLLGVVALGAATRLATGLPLSDAQCGYTAIGRRALAALDWTSAWPGYGYPNELLIRLAARRLRIAEVPVRPIYAGAPSKLRLRHVPPIAALLARASWQRWMAGPLEPAAAPTLDSLVRPRAAWQEGSAHGTQAAHA